MKFIKRKLFWKFFLSYFALVLVSMLVLGVVIRIILPGLFNNHLLSMAALFSQYGFEDAGHMMGGRSGMMMDGSVFFTDLFVIFNQIILDAVIYAFIPSVAITLLVSAFMSQRFVRPLQQMTQAADRIADGNYEERLPVRENSPEERDELERLAVRFNRMTMRLEQVEDLRQKLIGDVAHELRTPLTVIKGSMEGLKDGVLQPTESTFEMIYRQADRLDRLVNDLQELNHIESGILDLHLQRVPVNILIQKVVQTMQLNFTKKRIQLTMVLSDESLAIMADQDRFEQIMINLLSNALRYTPEGGEVRVSVVRKGSDVQVSVKDTGIGIPEEHLSLVFSRFYRVDDSRSRKDGGSGIGLTVAKKLVEAQGGKIWAESGGKGQGAVFRFTLPLA